MNKWEWETCDCKDPTNECGCGCKHSRLIMWQQIHWLGKHWRFECAFDHAVTLIRKERKAMIKTCCEWALWCFIAMIVAFGMMCVFESSFFAPIWRWTW